MHLHSFSGRRMAAGAVALNLLLAANGLLCPSVAEADTRERYTLRDSLAASRLDHERARARTRVTNGAPAYEETMRQRTLFTGQARWQMGPQLVEQAAAQSGGKSRQELAEWPLVETPPGAVQGRNLARLNLGNHMLTCGYWPTSGADGRAPFRLTFWQSDRRIKLHPEAIQALSGGEIADVAVDQCPDTLGKAVGLSYGPLFWDQYTEVVNKERKRIEQQARNAPASKALRVKAAHTDAQRNGLRFASEFYGDFDVTNTEAQLMFHQVHDVDKLASTESGVWLFNADYRVVRQERSVSLKQEVQRLQAAGHKLLQCKYQGNSLYDSLQAHWIAPHFWYEARPKTISPELAAWIETANFPLVDIAVAECPQYVGGFFALAQGSNSEQGKKLAAKAGRAVLVEREPERAPCARLLGVAVDKSTPRAAAREPTEFEMCTALHRNLSDQLHAREAGAEVAANKAEEVLGGAFGKITADGIRRAGNMSRAWQGGKWRFEVLHFKKTVCAKSGDAFECGFDIKLNQITAGSPGPAMGTGKGITNTIAGQGAGSFDWDGKRWSMAVASTTSSPGSGNQEPGKIFDFEGLKNSYEEAAEQRRQREQTERDRQFERDGWKIKNP